MNRYTDHVPNMRNSRTSLPSDESKSKRLTVETVIDSVGYGIEQWKMIIFTTLVISIEGMHFNLFSLLLIPIKEKYQLSVLLIQIISGILFIGVFLGFLSSGYMIQRYKRIHIINFFMFVTFVLHFILAFVNSIFFFSIIRICLVFCIGVFICFKLICFANMFPQNYDLFYSIQPGLVIISANYF